MEKGQDRSIHFPLSQTVKIAFLSLKIRWQRSVFITVSLILAISFFSYVLANVEICKSLGEDNSSITLQRLCPSKGNGLYGISSRQLWLLAMSLLICLAGITNAQLMAVTERFREIGTFKCLGALDRFIVTLLIVEICIYGIAGGITGGFLGILMAAASFILRLDLSKIALLSILPHTSFIVVVLAVLVSIGLSFIGALYPVMLAAKMEPSVALRHEE